MPDVVGHPYSITPSSRIQKTRAHNTHQRSRRSDSSSLKSTERRESGMIRPLARRQTVDADVFKMRKRLHATAPEKSHSYGLPYANFQARKESSNLPKAQAAEEPEDINDKIKKMLAATEALKPGSGQLPDTAGPTRSRVVSSRVLKKISGAWAKFNTKNENADKDMFQSPRASLRSAELRRNEDINFNNSQKAWRLAGMGIKRKPLPKDSHFFRRDDEVSPHTNDRHNSDPDRSVVNSTVVLENPFDAEIEFETNLEARILSAIPEASSTPRLTRAKLTLYDCGQQMPVFQIESRTDSHRDKQQSADEKTCKIIDVQIGHKFNRHGGELQFVGFKKHPSPDKSWLEALSNGFQTYRCLKATGAPDEDLDELAEHFVFPPKSGFEGHMRRFSSSTTSGSITTTTSSYTRAESPLGHRHTSRIHGPIEKPGSSQVHRRQAHPFRPTNSDADSPDELQ